MPGYAWKHWCAQTMNLDDPRIIGVCRPGSRKSTAVDGWSPYVRSGCGFRRALRSCRGGGRRTMQRRRSGCIAVRPSGWCGRPWAGCRWRAWPSPVPGRPGGSRLLLEGLNELVIGDPAVAVEIEERVAAGDGGAVGEDCGRDGGLAAGQGVVCCFFVQRMLLSGSADVRCCGDAADVEQCYSHFSTQPQ